LHIDIENLHKRTIVNQDSTTTKASKLKPPVDQVSTVPEVGKLHPDRVQQILSEERVSPMPRDLTEDRRHDQILASAEMVMQESFRDRTTAQQGRVNLLPTTKTQLKKATRINRLQEEERKREAERSQRLWEIRAPVIRNLSKD
jgi:hypothetical protein